MKVAKKYIAPYMKPFTSRVVGGSAPPTHKSLATVGSTVATPDLWAAPLAACAPAKLLVAALTVSKCCCNACMCKDRNGGHGENGVGCIY